MVNKLWRLSNLKAYFSVAIPWICLKFKKSFIINNFDKRKECLLLLYIFDLRVLNPISSMTITLCTIPSSGGEN